MCNKVKKFYAGDIVEVTSGKYKLSKYVESMSARDQNEKTVSSEYTAVIANCFRIEKHHYGTNNRSSRSEITYMKGKT